jgi:hypothetical protein
MREQFMRIAMARLRSTYPFKPQRRAVAANTIGILKQTRNERGRTKQRYVRMQSPTTTNQSQ